MNFALEELRQVDWLVIKMKKVPFPLILLLFAHCFSDHMAVVRTSFFSTQFRKLQNFAFALSKSLGILSSLFSPHPTWQTSKLAFAFSQAYFFHIRVNFFTSNLDSQYSVFALSTTIFFSASCLRRRL